MAISGTAVVLIIVVVVIILFLIGKCSLSCSSYKKGSVEGYKRACLGGDCYGLQRTPVDYAFKYPHGWQRDPHWRTLPTVKYQPLDYGPIDFYPDTRRMDEQHGVLFQQYRNDWQGVGRELNDLANDEKNRGDLMFVGDYTASSDVMSNMWNPRFGPRSAPQGLVEASFNEPVDKYKAYGGVRGEWLLYDKLGD